MLPLLIDHVGATSIRIHWSAPSVVEFPISHYLVNASSLHSVNSVATTELNTATNITSFNVTGLLPGTTYELGIEPLINVYAKDTLVRGSPPVWM